MPNNTIWKQKMRTMTRTIRNLALAVSLGASVVSAEAQEGKGLIVRDVNVGFVAKGAMNDRTAFRSSLPAVVLSQRPVPTKPNDTIPQPLGVITFEGTPTDRVDILLEYDQSARLLARWPHIDSRSTRALWRRMDLVRATDPPSTPFPATSWLNPLRNAERLAFKQEQRVDKLIAYDLSLKATTSIELEATPTGYKARNIGPAVIHDVMVYRPSGNGKFRPAYAQELPGLGKAVASTATAEPAPSSPPPGAAPAVAVAPANPAGLLARLIVGNVATNAAPEQPAPTDEKPAATVAPASNAPQHDVRWAGEDRTREELIADWEPRLTALGLGAVEIAHVQSILRAHAFDKDSARVVFRLDAATVETLAPLEVSPAPDRLNRVWLVIFDGADPEIRTRITALIVQLGDSSYAKRMEAKAQLLKLGPTAIPQLAAEKENKDPEIAFRIEEILEEVQNPGADPKADGVQAEAIFFDN